MTKLDDLDHPCRQTCSGWKQGYERGKREADKSTVAPKRKHMPLVHLMTQRDQPYGSQRKCCELCGQGFPDLYFETQAEYDKGMAEGFIACTAVSSSVEREGE